MSRIRLLAVTAVVLVGVFTLAACTPASPEERVAEMRSRFEARVNGFYVQAEPQVVEPEVDVELGEGEAVPADEAGDGEEGVDAEIMDEEVTMVQNASLDLILQHDNTEMLPGITVEIIMADANEQEKGHWQLWVDTSTLRKANQLQLVHVLEDVPYVEGDMFAAEIRSPIPPEERGNYQEFTSAGE